MDGASECSLEQVAASKETPYLGRCAIHSAVRAIGALQQQCATGKEKKKRKGKARQSNLCRKRPQATNRASRRQSCRPLSSNAACCIAIRPPMGQSADVSTSAFLLSPPAGLTISSKVLNSSEFVYNFVASPSASITAAMRAGMLCA